MAAKTDALSPDLFRVIDANLNRLKEGIRVIEDIARYLQNDKTTASSLKALRHRSRIDDLQNLLSSRDSINDVLRPTVESELNRSSIESILIANYKRAQESSRVLEEMYKIVDPALSETFKQIRYELYTLEKEHLLSSE
ncbi:thiamine-phosphate pyrophosphorylase [Sulfurimonas diazotrophicus]|uniref:Thiamine-phosphate pyrophosphorylase n=1 Tax=Sulfurimonas diazotrophicus TaxID=3131939 RepID=A0ABZ3HB94_9BACT